LLLVVNKIGNKKISFFVVFAKFLFFYFSEEWITAIELINQQTTPHLQQQLSNDNNINMVMNDDANNPGNEYPLMNEIFTRRPV